MELIQKWLNSKARDLEVAIFNTVAFNDDPKYVCYALSLFQTADGGFAGIYNNDAVASIEETYHGLKILMDVNYISGDSLCNEVIRSAFKYLFMQKDIKASPYYIGILSLGTKFLKKQNVNYKKCNEDLPKAVKEYMTHEANKEELVSLMIARECINLDENVINKINNDLKQVVEMDYDKWDDKAVLPLDIIINTNYVNDDFSTLVGKNLEYILSKRLQSGVWLKDGEDDINVVKLSGALTVKNYITLKKFNRM